MIFHSQSKGKFHQVLGSVLFPMVARVLSGVLHLYYSFLQLYLFFLCHKHILDCCCCIRFLGSCIRYISYVLFHCKGILCLFPWSLQLWISNIVNVCICFQCHCICILCHCICISCRCIFILCDCICIQGHCMCILWHCICILYRCICILYLYICVCLGHWHSLLFPLGKSIIITNLSFITKLAV